MVCWQSAFMSMSELLLSSDNFWNTFGREETGEDLAELELGLAFFGRQFTAASLYGITGNYHLCWSPNVS